MTAIILILILAPAIVFSCAVAIALACHLAQWPFDVRRKAKDAQIDKLMQREWILTQRNHDLTRQLNAVTQAERRLNCTPAVAGATGQEWRMQ